MNVLAAAAWTWLGVTAVSLGAGVLTAIAVLLVVDAWERRSWRRPQR